MPASKQMSMRRRASATSVAPQALKNSPLPPNVPVPKLSADTLRPEPPRSLYSMAARMLEAGAGMQELDLLPDAFNSVLIEDVVAADEGDVEFQRLGG